MGGETGFRLTIGDEPLVRKVFLESEMAHLRCVHAPVCLDNANVVIDRMTHTQATQQGATNTSGVDFDAS